MKDIKELTKKLEKIAVEINKTAITVIEVEGTNFIKRNFQRQSFDDGTEKKWKPRKTTDRRGRDITRYRTNRRGRKGNLTKFGKQNKGRAILTGHNTGGDKLRNSFIAHAQKDKVTWKSHKKYAKTHNEGLDGMPKRQFIGKSKTLEKNINRKLDKAIKKLFGR